jgi:hypothetical protein
MKTLIVFSVLAAAAVIAAPALAQAAVLDFSTKGDFVYLDFNPPGGKAPAVKLACTKGQGRITLAQYEATPADMTLNLTSGAVNASYAGKKSAGAHGDFVKAEIFASEKVMTSFRSTGNLGISGPGFQDKISATGPAKATLEQFFAGCEEGK